MIQCKPSANDSSIIQEEAIVAFDTNHINATMSPCENFYHYAIGSWLENNPVPPTESRWMSFSILAEENKQKTIEILRETASNKDAVKGSYEQLIRDLYVSAMDSSGIEAKGLKSLKPIFERIDNIRNMDDFSSVLGYLRTVGVSTPIAMYVGRDSKYSDRYILNAMQSGLTLPDKEYYLSEKGKFSTIRNKYEEHINRMFSLADQEGSASSAEILKIETSLAAVHWDREELREPEKNYNKMGINDFAHMMSNINLSSALKAMNLEAVDTLIVGQPSFFMSLNRVLGQSHLPTWKGYLKWQVINTYGSHCSFEMETESFNFFSHTLNGVNEMKPRIERVQQVVDKRLGVPLGKLFVDKHFPKESKDYMVKLIENLREAYRQRIKNLVWMGDSTKEKALQKLNAFTYKIGYPDEWRDYSKLDINANNLVQNLINISVFNFNFNAEKLGKPIDKNDWHMTPQMVNAYYSSTGNEVVFPAGILQPPFFHPDFDDAINYGGIGAVIGHEFTHGFDDKGSKSDWNGNLNNWWTDADRASFEKLTQALADQYSRYEGLPGMFVKGEMTLGENIADLGGLTLAFTALETEIGDQIIKPIDGFTWQQRFFLSWANIWKGNITEDAMRKRLLTDYHSPGEFRVLGPLANMPQFKDAFGCEGKDMVKPDSSMIRIW